MHVLSTIVQKGGDCKSKVLPPCVLEIVGQNSRGTNNVFECKQLLRFLENKMVGRSSWKSLKMVKLFLGVKLNHDGSPLKSYSAPKKNSSKGMEKKAQDLVVFV